MRANARMRTGALTCILAVTFGCVVGCALGYVVARPTPAVAAQHVLPADEYAARVSAAINDIDIALQQPMDARTASELAADVNTLLPITLPVEIDGGQMTVDNTILRTLVSRLDAAKSPQDRADIADEMRRHLLSLEASLGTQGAGVPQDPEALASIIVARTVPQRSPLSEIIGDIVEKLIVLLQKFWEATGGTSESTTIFTTVTIAVLAMLLTLLGWLLVRAVLHARAATATPETPDAERASGPVVLAAEGLPTDPLAYADELARTGMIREAVRALFGGVARALVEAGVVQQTRTRTDAELLSDVRAAAPRAHEMLQVLAHAFESAYYGHVELDELRYRDARAAYEAVLVAVRRPADGGEES